MKDSKQTMSDIYSPYNLSGRIELRNRFVMAPMTTWSGEANGELAIDELNYYKARSGGVGVVITATTYMTSHGQGFSGQFFGGSDSMECSLKALADAIHSGGAKAILQVFHAGRKANPSFMPDGITRSASAVPAKRELDQVPQAMTDSEIEEVINSFYEVTLRAERCGFEGIEIHGANTYLIQQFFSPHSNVREDQWGGSVQNRAAFPLAIIDACHRARLAMPQETGNRFVIGYRFSPEENSEPGITLADTDYLIEQLVITQLDYLHVSLGDFKGESIREYNVLENNKGSVLKRVYGKIAGRKPLIGVGSIRSAQDAQWASEQMDLLAVGRQLLVDPESVEKWQQGIAAFTHYDSKNREGLRIPKPLHEIIVERRDWVPVK